MAPTKRINDATAGSIAGADRFRPRRGPPGDDALRAGSTTHEREGGRYLGIPQNRRRCGWRPPGRRSAFRYGEARDFRLGPDNEGSIVNLQVEYFIRASGGTIMRRLEDLERSLGPLRAA
jgi:hypothetical protein